MIIEFCILSYHRLWNKLVLYRMLREKKKKLTCRLIWIFPFVWTAWYSLILGSIFSVRSLVHNHVQGFLFYHNVEWFCQLKHISHCTVLRPERISVVCGISLAVGVYWHYCGICLTLLSWFRCVLSCGSCWWLYRMAFGMPPCHGHTFHFSVACSTG